MTAIDFAGGPTLEGEGVRLRPWRDEDVDPYVAMTGDAAVMRYFPAPLSRQEAIDHIRDLQARQRRWGYTFWALETEDFPFAGFVGLSQPKFEAHFTPCVEIGWRLARAAWGKGLATKGGRLALQYGFYGHGLGEIVAMVVRDNAPSRAVAERLAMTCDPADGFTDPGAPIGSPHAACVLYRLSREKFEAAGS